VCVLRHGMPSSTAQGGGRNPEARREGPAGHRRYDHRIEPGIGRILMDETRKAIAELSAYWKQRSEFLSRPFPDGRLPGRMAAIASEELMNCALQLDRMLEGEPTEARGCGLHAMTKTGTDRVKKVSAILYEMLPPAGARTDYEGDIRRRGDEVFLHPGTLKTHHSAFLLIAK